MGDIHFYLKKAEQTTGESLIFLQWKYKGRILRYSFGQTIAPKDWNFKKERVKVKSRTTKDSRHNLNDLLDGLVDVCENAYNDNLKSGIPSPDVIKEELRKFVEGDEPEAPSVSFYSLMDDFMNNRILKKGKIKSNHTTKSYQTVYNHLKAFEKKKGYKVSFETIRVEFAEKYLNYLLSLPLAHNTITKHFKAIIAVMNRATTMGYTNNMEYKRDDFSMSYEEVDAVYLSTSEIERLYNFDLSNKKRLEQVRDLFVFGCLVGLRFQDFSNIKPENIITDGEDRFLHVRTNKTKDTVILPCHPIVLEIFEKYKHNKNMLPRTLSNQKFNEYIKEACKEAGFLEKGRLLSEPDKELYNCIGSHTCRRSFATNLYLQEFPVTEIMKLTGHRTEKAFRTYIKVSKLETAKRLSNHQKKHWESLKLRVAS